MKKKFIAHKHKKRNKSKFLIFLLLFIISLFTTFKILLNSNININNKNFVKLILSITYHTKQENFITTIYKGIKKKYSPVNLLATNYYGLVNKKKNHSITKVTNIYSNYLVYVYNSHLGD